MTDIPEDTGTAEKAGTWSLRWPTDSKEKAVAESRRKELKKSRSEYLHDLVLADLKSAEEGGTEEEATPPPEPVTSDDQALRREDLAAAIVLIVRLVKSTVFPLTTEQVQNAVKEFFTSGILQEELT